MATVSQEDATPRQAIDVSTLLRALDNARRNWDIIDYAHGVAHYLHQDGVLITLKGVPFNPSVLSLVEWNRLVRAEVTQ